ncbi:cupin domain-containing protein [Marinobacterium jannaschii]|uniref:cupin domain-containing protein n=1 Tax=Marinobacterium jannaschii TaxID=64970 RepID=UPI000A052977|nr:cupin domain-containing protein [Marinobacterium jannaschii]
MKLSQQLSQKLAQKLSQFGRQAIFAASISCVSFSVLAHEASVTPLMQKPLKGFPGQEGSMLIVEYGPGMASEKHRHDAHIFAYIIEGAVTMQVEGSEPVTLVAGDTFYESPEDIHLVSKNASATEPARIVVFSLNAKDAPIVIPVK